MSGTQSPATGEWEHFPHQADVGVRGRGPTLEAAFEGAARALTAAVADLDAVAPHDRIEVHCEAPDPELLLVEWLNALVFEMATRRMLFSRFTVRVDGPRLTGEAWGEPVDPARHGLGTEVKGATYTALAVTRDDGTWTAQCVVDV
jgi:tRNA nucleotidyltransferase (CCA-adding enzyme)